MITGTCLRNAIISGANNIAKHKNEIDDLNIFPVPDGDTGTNMSMTITAAVRELEKSESDEAGEVAHTTASALLRGARGNSGVILSLLFRGFSKGLEGLSTADGAALADALGLGVDAAYKAVMKPTEGTILTVARVAYEKGKAAAAIDNDPVYVWSSICKGAAEALVTTPELLPVLKKAGVVDAGGKGLCVIFDGMLSVFKDGFIIPNEIAAIRRDTEESDFFRSAAAEFDQDITFTYCTEFIVGRDTDVLTSPLELRAYLETIGDCVVVVDDEEIIKVHVHTENPGFALQAALKYGQLLTVKIENMKEQHRIAAEANERAKKKAEAEKVVVLEPAEPTEEVGFVAVAAGEGLKTLFMDLGCTHVVSGGQTMNPSTQDILAAVRATPAKIVFVLPNNKNIIMAAEQTVPLVADRRVIVVPTRTIPQGMAAMLAYDPDMEPAECAGQMAQSANGVATGQVTFAARDSEFGGHKIKENDIIALENGKLTMVEKDPVKAVIKLAKAMAKRDTSFITLITGEDVSEAQVEEARKGIQAKVGSHVDITVVNGGQPVYYFMVSVE